MDKSEQINFLALERELQAALVADQKYQRENDAKFRAIHQKVGSYEEFRDIVLASHLKPLDRKDKFGGSRKQPWNSYAVQSNCKDNSEIKNMQDGEPSRLPETSAEFYRDWRRFYKSQPERYSFLLRLGGENLGRLFRAEVGFGVFGELITTLSENYREEDKEAVFSILQSLSRTKRFSLNVDFLDKAEKESCLNLFQKLQGQDSIADPTKDPRAQTEEETVNLSILKDGNRNILVEQLQTPGEISTEKKTHSNALRDLCKVYNIS
ncbi:coiled-coil domain-containing protein 103 [Latimeria chalumnae]|uniref:Coiled-coil domain containing 103 n=1 Tax=Latimeria chalumnae TaxID=7897 RepID=H3AZM0_LATCH|nr:PREDICTED: coiled-coil domain-containing protein 103 [Latimeria chalumnae]XP_014346470.1 PREDICTED: coiled-coil domain-containing protein 103 [Latimeria chalumnae]|eukprot:XP_006000385.1 PREDICTED: coiled-coil domain-containing protein 103 [Latimeria chalumnae]